VPLRLLGKQLAVPFGVFLAVGATAALLFGPDLVAWYLGAAFGR
jgi:prepilin signal peptidase PulO-like enzyme (type II secretory pathway)